MGTISTANFIGYFIGIVFSARLVHRFGARYIAACGLLLTGVSMSTVAFAQDWLVLAGPVLVYRGRRCLGQHPRHCL